MASDLPPTASLPKCPKQLRRDAAVPGTQSTQKQKVGARIHVDTEARHYPEAVRLLLPVTLPFK